jgi:hypothetical protein
VDHFSVSNFSPSSPAIFTPSFDPSNVTMRNPNTGIKEYLVEINITLYYKEDILFTDRLASGFSQPFAIETNTRILM